MRFNQYVGESQKIIINYVHISINRRRLPFLRLVNGSFLRQTILSKMLFLDIAVGLLDGFSVVSNLHPFVVTGTLFVCLVVAFALFSCVKCVNSMLYHWCC